MSKARPRRAVALKNSIDEKLEKHKEIDEKDPELIPLNPVNLECRWVWTPPIGY